MLDISRTLREQLGEDARRVPIRKLPDWTVRLFGRFNTEMGGMLPLLGQRRNASGDKARRDLGWSPRPWQDAVTATARSLLALGVA